MSWLSPRRWWFKQDQARDHARDATWQAKYDTSYYQFYTLMKTKPHSGDVASLFERASALHTQAVLSFQSSSTITSNKSEYAFLQNILRSGTLSDRLSALTLLVQSSPLHNTKALDTLKSLAEKGKGKGGRGGSLKALRCIVDWWVGGGAPDRKLKCACSCGKCSYLTIVPDTFATKL